MEQLTQAETKMGEAVAAAEREFGKVRTGKAVPSILDSVLVDAYGGRMPLNQISTVTAPDAALLAIQPFDATLIEAIEKAVMAAGLGLNPSNDGTLVRVPIPPLSEERRREYVRLLHRMAEEARVSVRRARQAANDQIRGTLRSHEVGKDEARRAMGEIQKLTDEHVRRIDELLAAKEKEVMAI